MYSSLHPYSPRPCDTHQVQRDMMPLSSLDQMQVKLVRNEELISRPTSKEHPDKANPVVVLSSKILTDLR